ncbi:sensor histidine kinase [Pleomorphovibrio marinus]|uniref:sensor histidine kinase n=1 Tax=Pleomorphovibrio marinus TaxID=2164132 RepID=UPI000E0C8FD4|nr:ATP-binding protein [Pleomorphovibrio marinus]
MPILHSQVADIYTALASSSTDRETLYPLLEKLKAFTSAVWVAHINNGSSKDPLTWPKEILGEVKGYLDSLHEVQLNPQKITVINLSQLARISGKPNRPGRDIDHLLYLDASPSGNFLFGMPEDEGINTEQKTALSHFLEIFSRLHPLQNPRQALSPITKNNSRALLEPKIPSDLSGYFSSMGTESKSIGEEWFRNIAEYFPFPLFLSHLPDGSTLFVNQAFMKTFGPFSEPSEDLPTISEFIQGEKEKKLIVELIKGKRTIKGLEIALKTKARNVPTWFSVNSQHIQLGSPEAAITVLVDIHQRREAEQKLNRLNVLLQTLSEIQLNTYLQDDFEPSLEKFLENIMNLSDCMVAYLGEAKQDGTLVTQAFLNLYEQDSPEKQSNIGNKIKYDSPILGKLKKVTLEAQKPLIFNSAYAGSSHYALFSDTQEFKNFLGIPIYKGEELQGILALLDKEGDFTEKDIEFLKPLVWGYANLMKSIHTHREKIKAEQLRKEADNLYRLLSENTGDIILLFDLDFKIDYISPSVEKILGYKAAEVIGKKPSEAFDVVYPTSINFDEPHTTVIPHTRKESKQSIILEILFKPLKNKKNDTYSILATYRDVTERESVLKKIKKNLMKERELNHLKSQFISMASHEFRTPLATIMSSAELIDLFLSKEEQGNPTLDKIHSHIKKINLQTSRLSEIISNMLLLEKSVQNDLKISNKKTPILFFVKDLVSQFSDEVDKEIALFLPEKDKIVLTDPACLSHILRNLLQNAVNYSNNSQKNVELHLEFLNHAYEIRVKDYGMGIPKEDQKHIFETFFRANNVAKIKGTGLGLNIVKEFVNKLEGEISFSSKVGKGTEFVLRFPE